MSFQFAQWSAPTHVKALTTTRVGGQSTAPYDSLNLGDHVQDKKADVLANRVWLADALALPSEPVWLNQIHSTLVLDLDAANLTPHEVPTADGILSAQPNVVCAILTADCLPLFLTDKAGSKIALLHVGWRGMADGIIEAAAVAFNAAPADIIVWAGPTIGVDYFEIGQEVRQALGGSDSAYRSSLRPDKLFANLYQLAGERLAALGVHEYTHSAACTYRDEAEFFSYRRASHCYQSIDSKRASDNVSEMRGGRECGRMASLIWIDR